MSGPTVSIAMIREMGLDPYEVGALEREPDGEVKPKRKGKRRGEMNKTEARFLRQYLEPRKLAGEYEWIGYEPITLRLPGGVAYTLDFVAMAPDGRLDGFEIKGSWRAKNARDSRTRLKIAAGCIPWITFYAATCPRGGDWTIERITPERKD